jgi:hypothetical protein
MPSKIITRPRTVRKKLMISPSATTTSRSAVAGEGVYGLPERRVKGER